MSGPIEFFSQLGEFSRRYAVKRLRKDGKGNWAALSPWAGGVWPDGHPSGAVVHYTADEDIDRVLRWFLVERYGSWVSAHCVVALGWRDEDRELAADFPLVRDLPVMVVQCVSPDLRAWHARRSVNDDYYGIEIVNAGELHCVDGTFYTWRPRDRTSDAWTMPWARDGGEPIPLLDRWWAPYTGDQVRTCLTLLRCVDELYGGVVLPVNVLGHECVQEDKRDPGPAFPMGALRDAYASDDESGIQDFETDYMQPQHEIDQIFSSELDGLDVIGVFKLLGYAGDDPASILTFQRMMGLATDGIIGPITQKALLARARDRNIIWEQDRRV